MSMYEFLPGEPYSSRSEPDDDGPGVTACCGCGETIPEDDSGDAPFCGSCWSLLDTQGFFEP